MYKSVMMTALSRAHELGWLFDLGSGPLGIVYTPPPHKHQGICTSEAFDVFNSCKAMHLYALYHWYQRTEFVASWIPIFSDGIQNNGFESPYSISSEMLWKSVVAVFCLGVTSASPHQRIECYIFWSTLCVFWKLGCWLEKAPINLGLGYLSPK